MLGTPARADFQGLGVSRTLKTLIDFATSGWCIVCQHWQVLVVLGSELLLMLLWWP